MAGPRVFDEGTQFVGDETGYWVGTTKHEEIARYGIDGTIEMLVRWPAEDRVVGEAASELALQEQLATLPAAVDPGPTEELFRSRTVAELYPTHGLLVSDELGYLWMQTFERPGNDGWTEWRVFDPVGRLVSIVAIPRDHRVHDIGSDYIITVGRDDFDVEYVRMFELRRE